MRDSRFLYKNVYSASRALVIGINNYKNVAPLSYAVSDAEEIKNVLINELAFPADNITYLTDAEATRQAIMSAFMAYSRQDVDYDERIIVFFAGHGHTVPGMRGEVGFLVPYDANIQDNATLIRWDELTRGAELICAKHMLFIMDACYSGLALKRSTQEGSTRFLNDMMLRFSRQVITAGKADEPVSDDGGPIPNHSVFTGHLIEALRGKAANNDGVITANQLMSYVYSKVANDQNSQQTPHYGQFDGDGDFILLDPRKGKVDSDSIMDSERLILIPFISDFLLENTTTKVNKTKSLLASNSSTIELHDYAMVELKRFLAATNEDIFKLNAPNNCEELLNRVSRYETITMDFALLTTCIAYWGKPEHKGILQKITARSTDCLTIPNVNTFWLNLRWLPLIITMYCSGIAAIDAKRYDSLATIFYTTLSQSVYANVNKVFIEALSEGIHELFQDEAFKYLPGHRHQDFPMSEYLFKILQPKLDDALFLGMGYEQAFNEFEVLFSLAIADLGKIRDEEMWGPGGRFMYRLRSRNGPLQQVIQESTRMGKNWPPLVAGLFGGDYERFKAVLEGFQKYMKGN